MHSISFCIFALLLSLTFPALAQDAVPLKVVASFSILGDMAQEIGGEDIVLTTLVGPGEDAHAFEPKAKDAAQLADADVIIVNGLHFEGWIGRLIAASNTKAKLLIASAGVNPRLLDDTEHHDKESSTEIALDPHAWQDLRNGQLYVKNIALGLAAARPEKANAFKQRGRLLIEKLGALDGKARAAFAAIPADEKKIITTHDAFGYMAQAYGLTLLAPMGISTESQPSASDLAKLIKQIKTEHIRALFLENQADNRLIEQIAKDTGTHVGGTLYADTLTDKDGEAPTYLAMMSVNINGILAALRPSAPTHF